MKYDKLSFEELIECAKNIQMTPTELEEQRRSFAYGNLKIENPNITLEFINQVAEELARKPIE